jgi:hypothetical protein
MSQFAYTLIYINKKMPKVVVKQGTQGPERVKKRRVPMVRIPTLYEGAQYLGSRGGFQEDLKLILDTEQISVSTLARSIHADRVTVSRWLWGHHLPREPLTLDALRRWAERIRKEEGGNNHG